MPAFRVHPGRFRLPALALTLAAAGLASPSPVLAQTATRSVAAPAGSTVENSSLDAPLFYQLLIAEMQLRNGDPATGFQLLLDAARRSKDEAVFRRATDIALQARAGDQALAAVMAWREAVPASTEALRYHIQMLVALNRVAEAEEPLGKLLRQAARPTLPAMLDAVPRFLGRSTDRAATATLIERALQPYVDAPDTRTAALIAMGRGWFAVPDHAKALAYAQRAAAASPTADGPALFALDMLPAVPDAEAIVKARLASPPAAPAGLRLLYVRTLAGSQRLGEAVAEVTALTQKEPALAPPWLTLGALELELKHPKEATVALQTYVRLVEGGAAVGSSPVPAAPIVDDDGDDEVPATAGAALTQAWLLLAQAP